MRRSGRCCYGISETAGRSGEPLGSGDQAWTYDLAGRTRQGSEVRGAGARRESGRYTQRALAVLDPEGGVGGGASRELQSSSRTSSSVRGTELGQLGNLPRRKGTRGNVAQADAGDR